MTDWTSLILKALTDLGAEQVLVPGGKLREQVVKLGENEGQQFDEFLKSKAIKFGQLLEQIQQDVEVFRKPGADIYVGYKGASWPPNLPGQWASDKKKGLLRPDVYDALTKIVNTPFYYVHQRDEFTQNPDEKDKAIELPKVTLDALIEERREFACLQKASGIRNTLLEAIDSSSNPLTDFQRATTDLGLRQNWHQFRYARLQQRLETWAVNNEVPLSKSWFVSKRRNEYAEGPQAILAKFSQYMTDDEARGVHVPFRAVEAMYLDLTRKWSR